MKKDQVIDGVTVERLEYIELPLPKGFRTCKISVSRGDSGSWYTAFSLGFATYGTGYAAWPQFSEKYPSRADAVIAGARLIQAEIWAGPNSKRQPAVQMINTLDKLIEEQAAIRDAAQVPVMTSTVFQDTFAFVQPPAPAAPAKKAPKREKPAPCTTVQPGLFDEPPHRCDLCRASHPGCTDCCDTCRKKCNQNQVCRFPKNPEADHSGEYLTMVDIEAAIPLCATCKGGFCGIIGTVDQTTMHECTGYALEPCDAVERDKICPVKWRECAFREKCFGPANAEDCDCLAADAERDAKLAAAREKRLKAIEKRKAAPKTGKKK